jgi:uncharacterized protein (TIGR02996 family)
MTERDALLAAILDNPKDDMPRLVFADWLQEYGDGDLDRATEEFIRLSIRMTLKDQIILLANKNNWRGFVPTFAKNLHGYRVMDTFEWDDKSIIAMVICKVRDKATRYRSSSVLTTSVRLYFRGGFLWKYSCPSSIVKRKIEPAIYADQPLVKLQNQPAEL